MNAHAPHSTISTLALASTRRDWRHYAATAYCVRANPTTKETEVLLLFHKKLNSWLPPGGHVDENETPQAAAVREFEEETGLQVELVDGVLGFGGERFESFGDSHAITLPRPRWFQLEFLSKARLDATGSVLTPAHEHMDCVFLARLLPDERQNGKALDYHDSMKWFNATAVHALKDETDIFPNAKRIALEALSLFEKTQGKS